MSNHEMFSFSSKGKESCDKLEPGTSYEVFRNNTTAVEVIVKEVTQRRKPGDGQQAHQDAIIQKLQRDTECLKQELLEANARIACSKKNFRAFVLELKRQLDGAVQRDIDKQTENLALVLENEKLKAQLASKTNLITRLKKEIVSMKKIIKYVIKTVSPVQATENCTLSTEGEYEEFEKDLKKEGQVKFAPNMYDTMMFTFDSSLSKDVKSFDK